MANSGKRYLAFDLGAESGRAIAGTLDQGKLTLDTLHRFTTGAVRMGNTLFWDMPGILRELSNGLGLYGQKYGSELAGIGVDSWGVDFGLLDKNGELIGNPVHYRDARTNGVPEKLFRKMSRRDIYQYTGIQHMQINTLFQLYAMRLNESPALSIAQKILPIADLINYYLCGETVAEYTLATTTQMLDVHNGSWNSELCQLIGLHRELLPEIVASASVIGTLRDYWSSGAGVNVNTPIIAPACHDTAAAVAAVPAGNRDWLYISSGTWSLLGAELSQPNISDAAFRADFTNEGGVDSTYRFLKNIMGLWLIQECRRTWEQRGQTYDYATLAHLAEHAEPFRTIINPADARFLPPGDMPGRIAQFAQETGQPVPENPGQFIRASLESLALCYRQNIANLREITRLNPQVIHIVGGGSQNNLLNQFAADATGILVKAGPVEATALGNCLMQATSLGDIGSLNEAREIVRNSVQITEFTPSLEREEWDEAFNRYMNLCNRN